MKPLQIARCSFLIALPCLLAAADASLGGPIAGYVADPARPELRAILGVPGSYGFSDPIGLPDAVTRVHMAPGQDFAIMERRGTVPVAVSLSGAAVDHATVLPDQSLSSFTWVAFSHRGTAAVLFSAAANRLQVVTGLPDAPQLARDVDAASLPEPPRMAAVNDDGSLVLAASSRLVYRLSNSADVVLSAEEIAGLAVLPNGTDAVAAVPSTGSLHLLRNGSTHVVASGLSGIGRIYPASDGNSIYVTQAGAAAIASVNITTGEVRSFDSGVAAVSLIPLRNRDTFLISARSRQPGWVFYRDGESARSVFIPAVRSIAEGRR